MEAHGRAPPRPLAIGAVMRMTASEVPCAMRCAIPRSSTKAGTAMSPPPTPMNPASNPTPAPIGTWSNARRGQVVWPLIPPLAIGAALGGAAAAALAHALPQTLLARIFAIFLLGVAANSWRRAGGPPKPAPSHA